MLRKCIQIFWNWSGKRGMSPHVLAWIVAINIHPSVCPWSNHLLIDWLIPTYYVILLIHDFINWIILSSIHFPTQIYTLAGLFLLEDELPATFLTTRTTSDIWRGGKPMIIGIIPLDQACSWCLISSHLFFILHCVIVMCHVMFCAM